MGQTYSHYLHQGRSKKWYFLGLGPKPVTPHTHPPPLPTHHLPLPIHQRVAGRGASWSKYINLHLTLCRSLDRLFAKCDSRIGSYQTVALLQQSENFSDQMGRVANSKLLWTGESFFVDSVSSDQKQKKLQQNEIMYLSKVQILLPNEDPTMINQCYTRALLTTSQETLDKIESSALP